MDYILLILGFLLLIKGADYFVDGSSSVAKLLKVPSIIIGLTVVAFGTSMPELSVSVTAALQGNNDLAVSNVLGSNIFNLLVVLGCCAIISPVRAKWSLLKKEFPFSIGCGILLLVLGYIGMIVGHLDGVILLALFAGYIIYMVRSALKARAAGADVEEEEYKILPVWKSILFIVGGIIAIKFGGDFVVDGAVVIATGFGLSENLIGLTIVACGTSLPELVTSVVAAKKNEVDMALGNVIGSNIFNILFVVGTTALIVPVPFNPAFVIDSAVAIGAAVLLWICVVKNKKLVRSAGIVMLAGYAAYFAYLMMK